jgi:hypothetical protein
MKIDQFFDANVFSGFSHSMQKVFGKLFKYEVYIEVSVHLSQYQKFVKSYMIDLLLTYPHK